MWGCGDVGTWGCGDVGMWVRVNSVGDGRHVEQRSYSWVSLPPVLIQAMGAQSRGGKFAHHALVAHDLRKPLQPPDVAGEPDVNFLERKPGVLVPLLEAQKRAYAQASTQ